MLKIHVANNTLLIQITRRQTRKLRLISFSIVLFMYVYITALIIIQKGYKKKKKFVLIYPISTEIVKI
jgi:hypothetical protein